MSAFRGYQFGQALKKEGLAIIAEIKRRSPSAGNLAAELDVAKLARSYRDGGAACLSVLTESSHFGGSAEDLILARQVANIPVLRKDFITNAQDIKDSQAMAADAILLIVADIEASSLYELHKLAREAGMDVLSEVRNQAELELALEAGAYMIAINQRNNPKSSRFSIDYDRAVEMSQLLADKDNIIKVAASGIGVEGGSHVKDLAEAGYDGLLIGEALLRASDPEAKLRSWLA